MELQVDVVFIWPNTSGGNRVETHFQKLITSLFFKRVYLLISHTLSVKVKLTTNLQFLKQYIKNGLCVLGTKSHTDITVKLKHIIPSFPDLNGHGPRDHVPRGQIFGIGCVTFHEPLAFTVDQDSSLSTAALCDQASGSIDS